MQIIFDSRYDGLQDARTMLALLETYIDCHPAQRIATRSEIGVSAASSAQFQVAGTTGLQAGWAGDVNGLPGGVYSPQPQAAEAPPPPAPSDAAAAPLPTAPAASTAGAPPPPPAPSPPAAPATAPAAPAAPTSLVVDVTGLPWDERIHAANKATIANGQWRKKKGLNDEAYIKGVVTELRAAHPVTAAAPPPPPPPPSETTAATPPPPPPAPTETAAAAPPPPPPPADPQAESFASLMEWLGVQMSTGKIQFQTVVNECQKLGAKALADFSSNPNFMPMVPLLSAALRRL